MLTIICVIASVASLSQVDARVARADARNPAASLTHARYQQKFAWLHVPAGEADSGWLNGMVRWWNKIEGDGQIYLPQWEALVYAYGQNLAYQRQNDAWFYEELNQQMHSVMYATRNFLEARAVEIAKMTEKKAQRDLKRHELDVTQNMEAIEKQRKTRADAVNLAAAQNHLKLANTAQQQKNYHSGEATRILMEFYDELNLAKKNGMSAAQWSKIVNLRSQFITQRNGETNQQYYYLVQYSHYVLYKYRFTW